jgi:glucose-1-phosphate thymidylyltransferase
MKGVILAGGLGTRLYPLTRVCNKCLLPVYDKPMIHYPIQSMVDSGIEDILLVCGGNSAGEFLSILGNGEEFGLKHLHYTYQKEASGIADALGLAEEWANGEPITVVLADNILEKPFKKHVEEFENNPNGARIFLYEVDSPQSYGVAEVDENGVVKSIEEKPKEPKSNLAVVGVYMYDSTVWEFIKRLQPSTRGELEITDVNNYYLQSGKLHAHKLEGEWYDCGENLDGYLQSQNAAYRWKNE